VPENAEDAWRAMGTLTAARIPSYLGPDNVMHLEEFRGKFDGQATLKIRDVDRKRALIALRRAADAGWWDNEKEEDDDPEEKKEYAILCPKCRSAKVVMEGQNTDLAESPPTAKFQWGCDACGHQWVDDGIAHEAAGGQSWPGEEFPSGDENASERNPKWRARPRWFR
jgi:DNA-directed RNA polymerase subunit M/transcription elongation factor TFIIS